MARPSKVGIVGLAAVAAVVVLSAFVGARPVKRYDFPCSAPDMYVYPFWSVCDFPATLNTSYQYLGGGMGGGALQPEWDESNSTYYVRLTGSSTDNGAKYVAAVSSNSRLGQTSSDYLLVDSTVYIVNAESLRSLVWREEGSNEFFLIEQEVSAIEEGAPFRFVRAEGVRLPCPRILGAQCHAYYILSETSASSGTGLQGYEENGVTYIKAATAGTTGLLPFLLVRPGLDLAFPTIRTVTT